MAVFSIGHSTRTLDEFLEILRNFEIKKVFDVRTVTRSRRNPQFNQESLPGKLKKSGITYKHIKGLGGFRRTNRDSLNTGWRNDSFRGFADYMQTDEFKENIEGLIREMGKVNSVIMCAEAVPWRCHRSLIADALLVRGIKVGHILGEYHSLSHELTSFAEVHGHSIIYPGKDS